MARRDQNTLDMFIDLKPVAVVERFDDEVIGRGSLDLQICRVVAEAMAQSGKSRERIAAEMSDFLGFPVDEKGRRPNGAVTENMLDCYASQARKDHRITLERFIALVDVTGCRAALEFVAEMFDRILVPRRYGAVIKKFQLDGVREKLDREMQAIDAELRGWK